MDIGLLELDCWMKGKGMGRIMMVLHKLWGFLVEGRGLRETCKKIWRGFWKEIDRILGLAAREILKLKTPIVQNKVFFHTQDNRYTCNPKYICEELLRRNEDVDIVWRAPAKNVSIGEFPSGVRTVKAGNFFYYKEIFSANVIVTNSILFKDQAIYLKKGQTLIETWHGSLGIKRFGKKDYKSSWRWVRGAVATGRMTDYCITNSTFVSGSLRRTYWEKTPMLEYGHPRNDLFFDTNRNKRELLRKELCEKWEVKPDCKFVMYGPTFRDSKDFECYDVDFGRLTDALEKRFGGEWVVLLRYHPSLRSVVKSRGYKPCEDERHRIIDVTGHADMQELIAVVDVAITDYSSWIYDFMLLRRPGFIFATDIEKYNNERGFCYPLEETPFPIATNNDELMNNILEFNIEKYSADLEAFLQNKGCIEDGHASERVVDLIEKIIGR